MEADGETQKDPAAQCSVFDVVLKDIVPQNAYPGCRMDIAEGERYERRSSSQKCGGYGHEARDCHSMPRNYPEQRFGPNESKPPPLVHRARCAVEIRELPRTNSEKEIPLLELKPREQMEVMKSGVCLDVDARAKLQLVNRKEGQRCVEVLRDIGCIGVLNEIW